MTSGSSNAGNDFQFAAALFAFLDIYGEDALKPLCPGLTIAASFP